MSSGVWHRGQLKIEVTLNSLSRSTWRHVLHMCTDASCTALDRERERENQPSGGGVGGGHRGVNQLEAKDTPVGHGD